MRRHIRNACTIAPNQKNGEEGMDLLYEMVKQHAQLTDMMRAGVLERRQDAAAPPVALAAYEGGSVHANVLVSITVHQQLRGRSLVAAAPAHRA
jgi:hypothetical protein